MKATRDHLAPQKQALSRYLDALLRDDRDLPENAFEPVDIMPPDPATHAGPGGPVFDGTPLPAQTDAPASPPESSLISDSPARPDGPVPSWAGGIFEVQLLVVSGLTVGLPRSALVAVMDSNDLIRSGDDAPPWLLGAIGYRDGQIQVVDTARWVLPENLQPGPLVHRTGKFPVAVIDNGRWGLACDSVAGIVTLAPEQVRWRTARTQRRWLAGMASQHGFALLDPVQLASLLAEGLPPKA